MALCEMRIVISSGYAASMCLTIARGDQRFRSFSMTYPRRRSSPANRLLPCLREEARRSARFPPSSRKRAIPALTAVVMYFARDGTRHSTQPPCDCRETSPLRKASADFLALSR